MIVKEAKQKILPEVTDEWVDEASEFETVDELRADIRRRLDMMQILQAQMAVRDKVLEAAADLVPVPAPEALVEQRDPTAASRISRTGCRTRRCRSTSTSRRRVKNPRRSSKRCAPARHVACSPTWRCAR